MNLLKNLKIGRRLALGFALTIGAALAIAVYARTALSDVKAQLDLLTLDRIVKIDQLVEIKDNLNVTARAVRNIALLNDVKQMQAENKRIGEARARNAELLKVLGAAIQEPEGLTLLKGANDSGALYNAAMDKAVALGLANQDDEARELLMGPARVVQTNYFKAVSDLIDFQRGLMKDSVQRVDKTVLLSSSIMIGIALVAGALGALLAWLITRSITLPIRTAVEVAEAVAAGDLSYRIDVESTDETGQLLGALKRMNDSLIDIVGDVRNASDSIATGSAQIATGNLDLSQRTEEQASNLEQTAASMEQLTATVKNNSDTARQASTLALSASAVARQGGDVVGQVVDTMKAITASSEKIADIIGVIDGIAFQTNILALNAAVEAARAGEQGRGFAVVATEVRNLAQRSAQAAKEIKGLIGSSVEQVQAGSSLVGSAGQTMEQIVTQVKRVTDLIAEISAASIEQSGGIGQIGEAVNQLDHVTQQNAALVEESAAAAESLKHQAAQLAQTVAVFKL